jgi:hypothetical protein
MQRGASFPLMPKQRTPFIQETQRYMITHFKFQGMAPHVCNTLIFRKFKTCQANAFHLNSNRKIFNNLIGCISCHAYFIF